MYLKGGWLKKAIKLRTRGEPRQNITDKFRRRWLSGPLEQLEISRSSSGMSSGNLCLVGGG